MYVQLLKDKMPGAELAGCQPPTNRAHRPLGPRTPEPRPPAQFPPDPTNARNPPRLHKNSGGAEKSGMGPTGAALDYATCNVARYYSDVRFAHKRLRRFYELGDARGLNAAHMARVRRLLTALQDASSPQDMALPGCRLHQLTGDRRSQWSVRVSGNWRIVFRFVDGVAVDVNLIDYH